MGALLLVAAIFTVAVIVYAILDWLLPRDPDLLTPWTHAEPFPPAARRRPCLTAGCCMVDHAYHGRAVPTYELPSNRRGW